MKLAYFASVREKIGVAEETVALPQSVSTVQDLLDWLETRGDNFAAALHPAGLVRVAVDHTHAQPHTPLGEAREVALFPPMTGG